MKNKVRSIVYIDGANLYKGSLELNKKINYKKLNGWLRQKYNANQIYLFLGLIPKYAKLYKSLQEFGYILIFKDTVVNGKMEIKGNCDAELVLKVSSDFYESKTNNFVIVSGDGDFGCLVNFLIERNQKVSVLSPDKEKCSFLLRKTKAKIIFLNDHYHKICF